MKLISIFFLFFNGLSVAQTTDVASVEEFFKEDTVMVIERNLEKGYAHPYILYIPKGTKKNIETPLLVEPNNTGFVSDSIEIHKRFALDLAAKSSVGNNVSRMLKIPLLVPIFPRPASKPLVYTHALDREAILEKDPELERLDLQLVSMISDARKRFKKLGLPIEENIFMTGFSASGSFVNRFAFLHPELLKAIATGGLNAVIMIPQEKLGEHELNFPLGVNDFRQITGKKFEKEEYLQIPQFIYMGQLDDNDAVENADAYSPEEREIIYTQIGKDMQPDRWNKFQELYLRNNVNVIFKTYEEVGHETTSEMNLEIIKFFHSHM